MRPALLHLDGALQSQDALVERCGAADGVELDMRILGPQFRLWARPDIIAALGACLTTQLPTGPLLVLTGSGDFHHVSSLLIARALDRTGRPLTIVHVDNHPDWVKFDRGMHCGSWAAKAARMPGVVRVVTLGVGSSDLRQPWRKGADLELVRHGRIVLFPLGKESDDPAFTIAGISRPTMAALGKDGFIDHLLTRIGTRDVYLTIDKDVLDPADAATNWDQGRMRLSYLRRLVARLGERHAIVGADICGDASPAVYGGPLATRLLKRAEALMDQPRSALVPAAAVALNQRANLALADEILALAA